MSELLALKNESKKCQRFGFESKDIKDSEYFLVFRETTAFPYKMGRDGQPKMLWSYEFPYYFQKGFNVKILSLGSSSSPYMLFVFKKDSDYPDNKVEIGLHFFIKDDDSEEIITKENVAKYSRQCCTWKGFIDFLLIV